MIAVVYGDLLLKDRKMHIVVEFKGAALKDKSQYNVVEFTPEEKEILVKDFESNSNNVWAHFAVKHYHPTEDEIVNLKDFVNRVLEENHLLTVYRKLNDYLLAKKKEKQLVD